MATLPVKPAKGLGPGAVQRMSALIKGSLGQVSATDFPTDPEEACKRLLSFLVLWYPTTNMRQPEERAAFQVACPRLNEGEVKQIVSSLHQYKAWLLRRKRNLKTGSRTDDWLKSLLDIVQTQVSEEQKPAKRLYSKQSLEAPEGCAVQSGSSTDMLAEGEAEMSENVCRKPATGSRDAIEFVFPSQSSVTECQSDIVSVSSGDIVPVARIASEKPAKAMKRPAKKRPASCEEGVSEKKSKPAKAVAKEKESEKAVEKSGKAVGSKKEEPEKAVGSKKQKPAKAAVSKKQKPVKAVAWKSSGSFGLVKLTKAKEKAYIQAKQKPESKAYCLVNVALPAGEKQSHFMGRLMEKACEEGWSKQALVEWKNKELECAMKSETGCQQAEA